MDMEHILISLFVCALSSGGALLLARRMRHRKAQPFYAVALWVLFSFVSFLLVLVVNTVSIDWYYVDDAVIAGFYTYFMENSRYFGVQSQENDESK